VKGSPIEHTSTRQTAGPLPACSKHAFTALLLWHCKGTDFVTRPFTLLPQYPFTPEYDAKWDTYRRNNPHLNNVGLKMNGMLFSLSTIDKVN
jgi:hypothetical protein